MESKPRIKAKRHKKRKPRTQVSSESDSEPERKEVKSEKEPEKTTPPASSKDMSDAEVTAAFTKFYMQRATTEFSEDLDRLRGADDFRDDALPLLINALQQGTFLFSIEEQKRIVMAGTEKEEKKADD
ncbi:putative ribosome assembly protein 3 [Hyaloscypha bicolor E]|uniref:Ribosome assembly protein 3 n=1 Tax=Hyaloscypha bicolor E TaxID=1095630 RepID=A0A2J6TWG4_9HELO|nr:putative ribosome assembly protein 3 [Hyaloscypha bicolor E]PMD67347.1 putative ribosome assembly protein 3 [Hyaloscypha bicolor E]